MPGTSYMLWRSMLVIVNVFSICRERRQFWGDNRALLLNTWFWLNGKRWEMCSKLCNMKVLHPTREHGFGGFLWSSCLVLNYNEHARKVIKWWTITSPHTVAPENALSSLVEPSAWRSDMIWSLAGRVEKHPISNNIYLLPLKYTMILLNIRISRVFFP